MIGYLLLGALGGALGLRAYENRKTAVHTGAAVSLPFFSKSIGSPVFSPLPSSPLPAGPYTNLTKDGQTKVIAQMRAIARDFYRKPTSWLYWSDYLQKLHDSLAISRVSAGSLSDVKRMEDIMRGHGQGSDENFRFTNLEPYLYPTGCS